MLNRLNRYKLIILMVCLVYWLFPLGMAHSLWGEKKPEKKEAAHVMTQAQLQSQVMAFADRFVSVIGSAIVSYEEQSAPTEERNTDVNLSINAVYSAFTIAADANPAGALLDMVTMVTLGRIIYQENIYEKFGARIEPIVQGYQKAEKDVWQLAAGVLTQTQQQKLHAIINKWRKDNPEVLFFPSVRFSDFSAFRGGSGAEDSESGGLFKSVENAIQKAEEVRLLAERGMFLASRVPILTGMLGRVWISQVAVQPNVKNILKDLDNLSEVSARLADVAEKLPDQIAIERDRTIKQAMENITLLTMTTINESAKKVSIERQAAIRQLLEGFSAERKKTIEDFLNEDQRIRGLLSAVQLALAEGNKLIGSADSLVKNLNIQPDKSKPAAPAKPFDIKEYQTTLKEASNTILQIHDLVRTIDQMGLERMLPQVFAAAEKAEAKGKEWVFFAFVLGIALIVIFLAGSVIAALVYRYFANRIFRLKSQPAGS